MTVCLLVKILSGIFRSTTVFFYCSSQYRCKLNAEHLNRIVKTARLNPISKTQSSSFTRYRFTSWKCYFWSGKEKTTFSPEHVCESDRGACVCTQLFSLGCHLVEIDGEKCPLERKPVRWLSGNMRVYAAIAH